MSNRAFTTLTTGVLAVIGTTGIGYAAALEITPNMKVHSSYVSYLPAEVKARQTLNAATTDGNAPWSFIDAKTNQAAGVDIDLINEAAKRLGLQVKWNVIQFSAGIPGVQSGRYDLYVSAMADTKKREEVVNFIGYSEEGSGVIVKKGNPLNIKAMTDLCGKRVSIVTGSMFPQIIENLNKQCDKPVVVSETADQTGPFLAVASGQADATMNTYGVSNYTLKTATEGIQTRLELSPIPRFAPANQGIAFAKTTPDLMAAVAGALQAMKEDGSYRKTMDRWDVGDATPEQVQINASMMN